MCLQVGARGMIARSDVGKLRTAVQAAPKSSGAPGRALKTGRGRGNPSRSSSDKKSGEACISIKCCGAYYLVRGQPGLLVRPKAETGLRYVCIGVCPRNPALCGRCWRPILLKTVLL